MARDLQDDQRWKYDELSPVQLLEKLSLHEDLVNSDELDRAEDLATLPSGDHLCWLAYFGSRHAILATPCLGNRGAAVNSIYGPSRHRHSTIRAVATSV